MPGAEIAAEVREALQGLGAEIGGGGPYQVTLSQKSNEPENPWDADNTTITTTDFYAVVTNYAKRLIDGEQIKAGDKKVIASIESDVVPAAGDKIEINGVEHNVLDVAVLSPSGVNLLYTMQCRRLV